MRWLPPFHNLSLTQPLSAAPPSPEGKGSDSLGSIIHRDVFIVDNCADSIKIVGLFYLIQRIPDNPSISHSFMPSHSDQVSHKTSLPSFAPIFIDPILNEILSPSVVHFSGRRPCCWTTLGGPN